VLSRQCVIRPPDELGRFRDVSTRCIQSVPLLGSVIPMVEVVPAYRSDLWLDARENGGHSRRVNLIERQRDPQRERSGHDRATTERLIRDALQSQMTGGVIKTTGQALPTAYAFPRRLSHKPSGSSAFCATVTSRGFRTESFRLRRDRSTSLERSYEVWQNGHCQFCITALVCATATARCRCLGIDGTMRVTSAKRCRGHRTLVAVGAMAPQCG
jgi:hypothetical protein